MLILETCKGGLAAVDNLVQLSICVPQASVMLETVVYLYAGGLTLYYPLGIGKNGKRTLL